MGRNERNGGKRSEIERLEGNWRGEKLARKISKKKENLSRK
jgi:hypothetical protein